MPNFPESLFTETFNQYDLLEPIAVALAGILTHIATVVVAFGWGFYVLGILAIAITVTFVNSSVLVQIMPVMRKGWTPSLLFVVCSLPVQVATIVEASIVNVG